MWRVFFALPSPRWPPAGLTRPGEEGRQAGREEHQVAPGDWSRVYGELRIRFISAGQSERRGCCREEQSTLNLPPRHPKNDNGATGKGGAPSSSGSPDVAWQRTPDR
ncbi:hypothetical protein E2C01_101188 [Portunus trituberculatus]|uniref:Uncharacterized protein n=1 Tax=Portunus trituberculatus TaxID=210409 RepID=A0A5B7KF73_PORTR|nr:hypothetical protein [Portunus trituberculatus]